VITKKEQSNFEPVTFVSVSGGGRFLLFSPREKIRGSTLSSLFRSFASARVRVGEGERMRKARGNDA
jgi:hypothetical protein